MQHRSKLAGMSDHIDDTFEHQSEPTASLNKIIGKNVQRLRIEQNLPKKTLARISSVSRPLLDKIENGEADVRLSCIVRIADGLSVTPAELLKPHR